MFGPVLFQGSEGAFLGSDLAFARPVQLLRQMLVSICHGVGCGAGQFGNAHQVILHYMDEPLLLQARYYSHVW